MICVNSTVTFVVADPVVVADCGFSLTALVASVDLALDCTATVAASLAAGADVTGVVWTSPNGTVDVNGTTGSMVVTDPGNYTLTATGMCDGLVVTDTVEVAVAQGACPVPQCGFTLVANLSSVALGADCTGVVGATLTAGSDVTDVAFTSSAGTPVVAGNGATVNVDAAGTYTLTATGMCLGSQLTDTVNVVVTQGDCVVLGPNALVVDKTALALVNDSTDTVNAAANNGGVITVASDVPFTRVGDVFTFGPAAAPGVATFTATFLDGTTQTHVVNIGHTVVVPSVITNLRLTVMSRVKTCG